MTNQNNNLHNEIINLMLINFTTLNKLKIKQINNYNYFNKTKSLNFEVIFDLIRFDYVIFLTDRYYNFFSRSLLAYFSKYNILYLNYKDKDNILHNLNIFNNFINSIDDNNIKIFRDAFEKRIKYLNFLENLIEPNILYKKISFSKEELFLSFEIFSIKKIEYKLRTFCQIAEKLGAEEIKIKYDLNFIKNKNITINLDSLSNGLSNNFKNIIKNDNSIEFIFNYSNQNYNLNLNKFYLINLIEEENEFFITKDDFNTDIDLKFLLDARCINLINEYHTNIIINQMNSLERNLSIKAKNIGLNLGINDDLDIKNSINIDIKFINIYDYPNSIDGYNIYHLKEGFWHLSNIIKSQLKNNLFDKKNIYLKINNFLSNNLKYTNNEKINLEILSNIIKVDYNKNYLDIIKNFNSNELEEIFYNYFENNLFFNNFNEFKNIFINPIKYFDIFLYDPFDTKILYDEKITIINNILNNDPLTKLYFISLQYHKIVEYKNSIFNKILEYLKIIYLTFNNNPNNNILSTCDYKLKEYFQYIFKILDDLFNASFGLNCFKVRSFNGAFNFIKEELNKIKLNNKDNNKILEIFKDIFTFMKKNKLFIYNSNDFYDAYKFKNIIYAITDDYLFFINKSIKDNNKHTDEYIHNNRQDTNFTHYKIFCTFDDLKKLLIEKDKIGTIIETKIIL